MLRFVLIIFLFSFANPLQSEDNASIYTVDMNKLLRLTDFGKNMVSVSNKQRQFLQDENDALEEELLQEEKNLSLLRKTLSADEFRPKAIEFDKKVTIIRTQQSEKEKNLIARSRKAESDFFKRIYPLLSQLLSDASLGKKAFAVCLTSCIVLSALQGYREKGHTAIPCQVE